jgi:hypothetical protein
LGEAKRLLEHPAVWFWPRFRVESQKQCACRAGRLLNLRTKGDQLDHERQARVSRHSDSGIWRRAFLAEGSRNRVLQQQICLVISRTQMMTAEHEPVLQIASRKHVEKQNATINVENEPPAPQRFEHIKNTDTVFYWRELHGFQPSALCFDIFSIVLEHYDEEIWREANAGSTRQYRTFSIQANPARSPLPQALLLVPEQR